MLPVLLGLILYQSSVKIMRCVISEHKERGHQYLVSLPFFHLANTKFSDGSLHGMAVPKKGFASYSESFHAVRKQ